MRAAVHTWADRRHRVSTPVTLLAWAMLFGCAPASPEWLEWTGRPGMQSMVAVVRGPGQAAVGTAAETERMPARVLAHPQATHLELLFYARTLGELGLDRGPLDPTATCRRSCDLAEPPLREVYALESSGLEPVAAAGVLEDSVLDLLVPDRAARCDAQCLDLESTVLPLEYGRFVRLTLPLPDGRIALIQDDGSSQLVTPEGTMAPGCRLPVPPAEQHAYPAGTWTDPAGTVWVSLEDGALLRVPLSEFAIPGPCPVETATVGPGGRTLYHITGNPDPGAPMEVVALTSDRSFWRFREGGWRMLGRLTGEGPGLHRRADLRRTGGVWWLGPGRAAAFQWEQEILYVDGETVELVPVYVSEAGTRLIAGARSELHGFLLSMRDLGVLKADDPRGPWTPLLRYTAQRLASIVPLRGQLLLASARQLEAFQDELGLCDRVDLANADYVRLVTPFPHAKVVLVGDYSESEPNEPFQRSAAIVRARLACD